MNAKQQAVKLLARREHSVLELRNKLLLRSYETEEIESALLELQQGDWQSDSRFAEAYVRMRQLKGFGPIRIAIELKERGVASEISAQFINASNPLWLDCLKREYEKKYGASAPDDYKERTRRMRFLQHRGFHVEKINEVVKWYIKQ